jgi:hypothetical protein
MPKFARYGPHIPDALVQALEDDRVVIFCGAGVSMGAGLPSYVGLVAHCYRALGAALPDDKSDDWKWPDRMLGVLENDFGAAEVRRVAAERLSQEPTDLSLHKAILQLARLNNVDGLRLVTTNFDTFFERAQEGGVERCGVHAGPVLPIPRDDRVVSWRSIAYLHGRLGDEIGNRQLVMTSADFGRAYLTEGWAARFVARLFGDFTVLFIGYSLNDPVLRYMTDAFAAEEANARHTDHRERAYIFVEYNAKTDRNPKRWRDRGVEPIFYNKERNHRRLGETLIGWAEARRDYLNSTATIISRLAPSRPQSLDPSDTDNLVWAVVGRPDDQGHGAKTFAGLTEPPPIEWLAEFERGEAKQLAEWSEALERAKLEKISPPSRPTLNFEPLIVLEGVEPQDLRQTSGYLIDWLVRRLDSIELIDWVLEAFARGRRLHPRFRSAIRRRLRTVECAPGIGLFWRLVSAEGAWVRQDVPANALWDITHDLAHHGSEAWMRQELLALLRPYVRLSQSYGRALSSHPDIGHNEGPVPGQTLASLSEGAVKLVGGDRMGLITEAINKMDDPEGFLASLAYDLTGLLRAVFELFAVMELASRHEDYGTISRPSIRPHGQNSDHEKWALLVDWLWRAWVHIDATEPMASRAIVEQWRRIPYLTFQRLRLAAMTDSVHFSLDEKLEALLGA